MSLDPTTPALTAPTAGDGAGSTSYILYERVPTDRVAGDPKHSQELLVRRPVAGLLPQKGDYATLEIVAKLGDRREGTYVEVLNSSYLGGRAPGTTNFLVNAFQEGPAQSAQVVKTLNSNYLSSIGRTASMISVEGYLLQADNFLWLSEWRKNYDLYLSADQCVLRKAQVYLTVGGVLYVGYLLNTQLAQTAATSWQVVSFGFTFFVTATHDLNLVKTEAADGTAQWRPNMVEPLRSSATGADDVVQIEESLQAFRNAELIRGGYSEDITYDFTPKDMRALDEHTWAEASGTVLNDPETQVGYWRATLPADMDLDTAPEAYL